MVNTANYTLDSRALFVSFLSWHGGGHRANGSLRKSLAGRWEGVPCRLSGSNQKKFQLFFHLHRNNAIFPVHLLNTKETFC